LTTGREVVERGFVRRIQAGGRRPMKASTVDDSGNQCPLERIRIQ